MNPESIKIFADEQILNNEVYYGKFTVDSIRWVKGKWISEREVWVPAQLVYLFFPFGKGEAKVGYSTSGGYRYMIMNFSTLSWNYRMHRKGPN